MDHPKGMGGSLERAEDAKKKPLDEIDEKLKALEKRARDGEIVDDEIKELIRQREKIMQEQDIA